MNVEGAMTSVLGVNNAENPPTVFVNDKVKRLVRDAMYMSRSGVSPFKMRMLEVRPASQDEERFFDTS